MKNILSAFWAGAVFFTAISCAHKEKETFTETENSESIVLETSQLSNIEIITLEESKVNNSLTVVGEVSFDEDHVVRIYPIVSGSVEDVYVSLGDYVQRGQMLAKILSTDISQYQRDYNIAKSNFDVATKNYERTKELYSTNFASEKELQQAENEYKNAQSEFFEKKQVLELYGGSANDLDATFQVIAPKSGYIVERNVNQGMQIRTDNAETMFTISDLKTVWIWANVYESDISRVAEGDSVQATTISYPDETFAGKILKIGNVLDPEARVIKVRTEVPNPDELLKPEMFATVRIIPKTQIEALVIPNQCIILENNRNYIIRAISNTEFEKIEIKTGRIFDEQTEVLDGIKSGDKIVREGAIFIANAIQNR